MNVLSVNKLKKHYSSFTLDDISFSIKQGRIMGLIGKNGAGKSTILKSILGLIHADEGSVEIFDKDFKQNEESIKQDIGVVLGGIDFYENKRLSTITNVTKRFYKNWDEQSYQKYIREFSLDPDKKVKELSTGMKVKYLIAVALSHNAKLLILDEPTSGLDPVSRDDLLTLFRELVKDVERSVLFSTHITSDLEKYDITYIKDGRLLESAEKSVFIESFQDLKGPGEDNLSIEDIMIRMERRSYDVSGFCSNSASTAATSSRDTSP